MNAPLSKSAVFAALPSVWPEDVMPRIREMLAARPNHTLVVLDDDPTGTQTVDSVPVLTTWDVETLARGFAGRERCFFILTNSRSLMAEETRALHQEIALNLRAAAGDELYTVLSRSDSTLRGHFPLETDVLSAALGSFDATLLVPYFEAGGRYTINDVHYLADGDTLTPVAGTPFARDAVFGYANSNLRRWVEEKTHGRVQAADVESITLDTIRSGGPEAVRAQLMRLPKGSCCIVNAAALRDTEVFALALLEAEQMGQRYLLRSAAQLVAARLGLEPRNLLTREEMKAHGPEGGLIVVGSHVPKTTEQLARLLTQTGIDRVGLPVPALIDAATRAPCIEAALTQVHAALLAGRDVVLYTSRDLISGYDAASNLHLSQSVSAALVAIVQRLEVRPRYLVAKGGITSSDLATKGLGLKRGMVLGQILPGIPVWRMGDETRFPDMPYIVFPGNVGGPDALLAVAASLQGTAAPSPEN